MLLLVRNDNGYARIEGITLGNTNPSLSSGVRYIRRCVSILRSKLPILGGARKL